MAELTIKLFFRNKGAFKMVHLNYEQYLSLPRL